MPRKVQQDSCIACGACSGECPTSAITVEDVASIDPSVCIDCGACEGVCPVGAISEE